MKKNTERKTRTKKTMEADQAKKEWQNIIRYASGFNHYGTVAIPLSEKGLNALRMLGGINIVCATPASEIKEIKKIFIDNYMNG